MARPVRDGMEIERRLLFWYSVRLLALTGTVVLLISAGFTPEFAAPMIGAAIGTGGSWWFAHERLTVAIDAYLKGERP